VADPPGEEEIRSLVERAARADADAFGRLYDTYVDQVYRFALFRLGNSHDAEDVAEQTFVKAFEAIGRYRWRNVPFSAWLFRIARNLVTDEFRKRGRTSEVDLEEVAPIIQAPGGTHEEVEARLWAVRLHAALGELTEDQRTVVLLKFFGGLSNGEVAKVIRKNEGSVKSLQHRALAALGRLLGEGER
jgi:RNA polymerase sigma-70 factor (ECF subfamily)